MQKENTMGGASALKFTVMGKKTWKTPNGETKKAADFTLSGNPEIVQGVEVTDKV